MREGYYSDKYFVRAREILLADRRDARVTMQVFGKSQAYLGGMDEAIAILKLCSDDWSELTVRALYDGEKVEPWETVMTIDGPVRDVRASRDPLPRRARAPHARRARTRASSSTPRTPKR